LVWTERSSTLVEEPTSAGFGSTLMRRAIEGQLGGTIERQWRPEGLCLRFLLPSDRL
jgi:two-component sensor histidine kinase